MSTRPPQVTRVPDLGLLPTPIPASPTAAPTPTPRPEMATVPPPPTPLPILPTPTPMATAVALVMSGGMLVAPHEVFEVDPSSLGVRRVDDAGVSALALDYGPGGQIAAVQDEDAQHPGFGYTLRLGGENLIGSPLPSATIRFTDVKWSPDGRAVAFVAETPGARRGEPIGDTPSDGLWVWRLPDNPQERNQLTHHALENRYEYHWGRDLARVVRDFEWSPDGQQLLVQQDRASGFGPQLVVIPWDHDAYGEPPILPYECGSWSRDGRRVLVSGLYRDTGSAVLGWVDPAGGEPDVLLDGRVQGLWMQDAVELPDGRIAFFGGPSASGAERPSAVNLYVHSGGQVTRLAGMASGGPALTVNWNAARSAAIVRLANGRTLIMGINGWVQDITATVGMGSVVWRE